MSLGRLDDNEDVLAPFPSVDPRNEAKEMKTIPGQSDMIDVYHRFLAFPSNSFRSERPEIGSNLAL